MVIHEFVKEILKKSDNRLSPTPSREAAMKQPHAAVLEFEKEAGRNPTEMDHFDGKITGY